LKQNEFNLLKSGRDPENSFLKGKRFNVTNTPRVANLKKQYYSIISQYLKEQNFEFNVVADLGCGLPFATLPFAQQDNKTLCCIDGYNENYERYYFSKQELDNFFAVQSGDVTFYNLDSNFKIPKVDVWISIMAVGKMIDPKLHYKTIKDNSNEDAKIFFVVYKDNWYDSITIENVIADSSNCEEMHLTSNVASGEVVLAEVKLTDNHLNV